MDVDPLFIRHFPYIDRYLRGTLKIRNSSTPKLNLVTLISRINRIHVLALNLLN
jgi:hypothetical protein